MSVTWETSFQNVVSANGLLGYQDDWTPWRNTRRKALGNEIFRVDLYLSLSQTHHSHFPRPLKSSFRIENTQIFCKSTFENVNGSASLDRISLCIAPSTDTPGEGILMWLA